MLAENVNKMFQTLEISGKVRVFDMYRLKSKKSNILNGQSLFSPVKVEFQSKIDRKIFFENVKKLKSSPYETVQVVQNVVKPLADQYHALDKLGFDLRKATKGLKSRISIVKQEYCLFTKLSKEKEWKQYKV